MIDLHIHILPDMDDGSRSMDESIEMARLAVESGVTDMAVTPHSYADKYFFQHKYQYVFDDFKAALAAENIDLNIYPGMEILAFFGMRRLLDEGVLKTINNTRYALVEFEFHEDEETIKEYLSELVDGGYKPIIAHLERYEAVWKSRTLVYDMQNMGCIFQMNKGSIVGSFGRHAMKTAWQLLNARLINIIASDAHSSEFRTPSMEETSNIIENEFSAEYRDILMEHNPRRVLEGRGIARFNPL